MFLNTKDILRRHAIIFLMALFFVSVGKVPIDIQGNGLVKQFASIFFYIACIWNLNLLAMDFIEKSFSWEKQSRLKLIIYLAFGLIIPIGVHFGYNLTIYPLIVGRPCPLNDKDIVMSLIISVTITLLVNAIMIGINFFQFWKNLLSEKEALKRNHITAEFETLKNQVNPHFLFNALNTLTSLIEEDQTTATKFVQKLSTVYRYVLSQRDKETASLGDEITFIQDYIYLNQIRFGTNLHAEILVEPRHFSNQIATLSLQMLVENAIKHNVISKDKPLHISIGVKDNAVYVKNNLQTKRQGGDSNGVGLSNIINRYKYLSKDEVEIVSTNEAFVVYIPMIATA